MLEENVLTVGITQFIISRSSQAINAIIPLLYLLHQHFRP